MKISSLMAFILPAIFFLSFAQAGPKIQANSQPQSVQNEIFKQDSYPVVDQKAANSPVLSAVYSASPGNNAGKQQSSSGDTTGGAKVTVLDRTLSIKVFPQGIYNPLTQLLNKAKDAYGDRFANDTADLVTIRLVNNTVPYNDICSFKDIALPINGILTVDIPDSLSSSYYLVINHRNSLETWSSIPVSLNGNMVFYNFTTGADKAYGFNLGQMGNSWVVFGGDINQDGAIDLGDMSPADNDVYNYVTGYLDTDVNGDGMIDTGDLSIIDNNSGNYIGSIFPHTQELPAVTTNPAQNISFTTATLSGEVTLQGGSPVTERGVCWGISLNPDLSNSHTTAGSGIGQFNINITGLIPGTPYYVRAYAINRAGTVYGNEVSLTTLWACGASITINHIAGEVAPVTKTVTYPTVSNVPGEPTKCWITSNLGADHSATSATDPSEASAGWYWQFNQKQGYKHDGSTRTPNTAWTYIDENTDWKPSNDPCTLGLGSGWRIPTSTEWGNVNMIGEWNNNPNAAFASALKLHASGYLSGDVAKLGDRGLDGYYWSCMHSDSEIVGWYLSISEGIKSINTSNFSPGYTLRCLCDTISLASLPIITTASFTNVSPTSAITGGNVTSDGGAVVISRGVCWSTTQYPTINDAITSDGTGIGTFASNIAGLSSGITYYVRAYATNSVGTAYGQQLNFRCLIPGGGPCPGIPTITYGEQTYNTTQIGTQCWLKENLNVGTRINGTQDQVATNGIKEKYCYDNLESNCDVYGGLYQWDEMMQGSLTQGVQGICPTGWHLPTQDELGILSNYLGGKYVSGGKLKETGTTHWDSPNVSATNESGFTALPGSMRNLDGTFNGLGGGGCWWSSTQTPFSAWHWELFHMGSVFEDEYGNSKAGGYSVRCLNDNIAPPTTPAVTTSAVTNIAQTTATGHGNVTSEGGVTVTARGVCWSTSQNPVSTGSHTIDGRGPGDFQSLITGLNSSTTYYVRAYATNSAGTAYGSQLSFTTTCVTCLEH